MLPFAAVRLLLQWLYCLSCQVAGNTFILLQYLIGNDNCIVGPWQKEDDCDSGQLPLLLTADLGLYLKCDWLQSFSCFTAKFVVVETPIRSGVAQLPRRTRSPGSDLFS